MFNKFVRDESGNFTVITAVAMVPIMAAVMGAVDYTNLGNQHNNVKNSLDSAGIAIATKIGSGMTNAELKQLGNDVFEANVDGNHQLTVDFDFDGVSQVNEDDVLTGTSLMVGDVYITVSTNMTLDSYFRYQPARNIELETKVALASIGKPCVLALNKTADKALEIGGTAIMSMENCSIMSNSNSDESLWLGGSADVKADCAGTSGGYKADPGQFDINCPYVRTDMYGAQDPFADIPTPPYSACKTLKKNETYIKSGTYCDMTISGDMTLEPGGTFIIRPNGGKKSGLTILNNDSLSGEEVTFFLMGGAEIKINGSAEVDLKAKTSGPYAGMLFYSEQGTSGLWTVGGGNDIKIQGILYNPGGHIDYHGNNSVTGECLRVVADTIRVTGTSSFVSECDTEFGGLDLTASTSLRIAS